MTLPGESPKAESRKVGRCLSKIDNEAGSGCEERED